MMSGEKTNAVLEQYLVLAKGARGAAAVSLVKQALEAPSLYVFGELLHCNSVKQLEESAEHKPYADLLRIFAYGKCSDYITNKQTLPEISAGMIRKLRHLTIVSLATNNKQIPYGLLLKELDLHNVRELEDLIIEAIYAGVIKARMDQSKQLLEVRYTLGRDIQISELSKLLVILEDWTGKCSESLTDIQNQIVAAQLKKAHRVTQNQQTEAEICNIKKTLKLTNAERSGVRSSTEHMDTAESKIAKKPSSSATKTKGLRGSAKVLKL